MAESNDQIASTLNQLYALYQLNFALSEMAQNILLIEEGSGGNFVTMNGGSLFDVAAKYYGDAKQWTTIAKANNLVDPELPPGIPITILIPSTSLPSTGVLTT
ncbi:MAG: hypothetical protein ACHP9Y_03070 [Gammaproteobacteria bacterium]